MTNQLPGVGFVAAAHSAMLLFFSFLLGEMAGSDIGCDINGYAGLFLGALTGGMVVHLVFIFSRERRR